MRVSVVAITLALVLAAACRESAAPVPPCELGATDCRPGLRVELRDSASGTLLAALRNARVEIVDGSYSEQLSPGPVTPGGVTVSYWLGAVERPGTYSMRVSAPGFRTWERDKIVVVRGPDGHAQTVDLIVPMQPIG